MTSGDLCAEPPIIANPSVQNGDEFQAAAQAELEWVVYGPDSSPTGFEHLEAEWNALVRRSRHNTFFLTHEWQTTWWNYLGEGDLWIVAFRRREGGELVGIAPFYLVTTGDNRRVFTLVGCIEVSDYLDLIVARGWEAQVYAALCAWLYSPDAPVWDTLDLCNLPQDSLTYRTLPPLFKAICQEVTVLREDLAPQFETPLRYETYLNEMVDKKQRHEIRRKQRRAEREATVGFYLVQPGDNLDAEMDDFIALQQASRADKASFMTPEMRRFFHAAARRMMDAGRLRLLFLTLNGEKAASLLAFEYDRRFLLYNSGYDPDAYAQLSPGWVLLAYAIQYSIAVGCHVFDFMQGDEEYKYRFGSHDYDVMRVVVQR